MDCCSNKPSMLSKIKGLFRNESTDRGNETAETRCIALVGNPNVGKSVIFNSLTGAYVTVSNYPGTTVEVSKGNFISEGVNYEVIDTPGMYSMLPITDEERVTRNLLMNRKPDLVVHVIDAKNMQRMLPMTLQLIEAGFQVILVLNIIDEAKSLGLEINRKELQKILGIPVVTASAVLNIGLNELKKIVKMQIENAA